jgi:hypothetical protein
MQHRISAQASLGRPSRTISSMMDLSDRPTAKASVINCFNSFISKSIQSWFEFSNQLAFTLVCRFATTDNFEHLITPFSISIIPNSITEGPVLVLIHSTTNVLLPTDFYTTEKSMTLGHSNTDVRIASVYALNTVQDMVSVTSFFSYHVVIITE